MSTKPKSEHTPLSLTLPVSVPGIPDQVPSSLSQLSGMPWLSAGWPWYSLPEASVTCHVGRGSSSSVCSPLPCVGQPKDDVHREQALPWTFSCP